MTGDIDFIKNNKAAHKGLIQHYEKPLAHSLSNNILDNINVVQIPHHGSEKNSCMNDFDYFKNASTYFITTQCITNGKNNPKVSKEYINNNKVKLLNEKQKDLFGNKIKVYF